MSSQNSSGCDREDSQTSRPSLNNSNRTNSNTQSVSTQTLSNSRQDGSTSQGDGRVSSTGLSGSERVYPIRSLVSMNPPNVTSPPVLEEVKETSSQPEDSPILDHDALTDARKPPSNYHLPLVSHKSLSVNDEVSSNTPATGDLEHTKDFFGPIEPVNRDTAPPENHNYVTSRFEHAFSETGHTVMLGDSNKTLKRCEDEPIRTPGAIQRFGALVALREESPNQLVVRAVSENSEQIIGFAPQRLFDLESFTDILEEDESVTFLEHLDIVRDDSYDLIIDGPEVFLLAIQGPYGKITRFWCATCD